MNAPANPTPKSLLLEMAQTLIVECIASEHPTLSGRVRVRWRIGAEEHTEWLPSLRGLSIREGDRLLVSRPGNWDEAIVIGVVDGFARRDKPAKRAAAELTLQPDEAICVRSSAGDALFEITSGENGPEIAFGRRDVEISVDGGLRFNAKRIAMHATEGEARIEASDDVVVVGENIHLN